MSRPILCLDFDGVIHSYTSGWKGATIIPDPVVEGTFEFLIEASDKFDLHIFSSRSHQEGGIEAMRTYLFSRYCEWLDQHPHADDCFPPNYFMALLFFPINKPSAMITIDDRAITFNGTWPEVAALRSFKPWNKQ